MGLISNFMGGMGSAAADYGKMTLMSKINQEAQEARDIRQANLQKGMQTERIGATSDEAKLARKSRESEGALDRASREGIADTKAEATATKDGSTTASKNARDLMAQGYPKDIANAVAQGAMKQIKDEETGDMVLINALTNKPVGRLTSGGTSGNKKWIPEGGQTENAPVTKAHRDSAKESASDKAGWTSTDKTDFPETSGDRKAWSKKEAQRLANEERAGGKGGIINSVATSPVQDAKAPYPDGTELKGKDGKIYIVKDGKPVLKTPQ